MSATEGAMVYPAQISADVSPPLRSNWIALVSQTHDLV